VRRRPTRPSIYSPRPRKDGANEPMQRPPAASRGAFFAVARTEFARQLNPAVGEYGTHPGTESSAPDDRNGERRARAGAVARTRREAAGDHGVVVTRRNRGKNNHQANIAELVRSIAINRSKSTRDHHIRDFCCYFVTGRLRRLRPAPKLDCR